MGPIGLVANIVLCAWTAFTLLMYSFPVRMPVTPGSQSLSVCVFPFSDVFANSKIQT